MGLIIKDGVTYAGSPTNAKNIRYDNKDSKLEATNIKDAIDELASGDSGAITLTEEEYMALSEEERNTGLYYITDDDTSILGEAEMIIYYNDKSGLDATDVQGALDEISNETTQLKADLSNKQPKGDYALKNEIPTDYAKENHTHSQYLTAVPSEYVTETELNAKGYLTQHQSLSGYAKTSDIPTKVSQLTNDAKYITSYTETDPTVPAWAKAANKPKYTASEVGAVTQEYVDSEIVNLKAQGVQQTPALAIGETLSECLEWLGENGDTTKVYIMKKSISEYVYGYIAKKSEGGTVVNGTNVMKNADSEIKQGYRYSTSGGSFKSADGYTALVFKLPTGTDITKGVDIRMTYPSVDTNVEYATYFGTSATSFNSGQTAHWETESEGICKTSKTISDSSFQWVVIHVLDSKVNGSVKDIVVTVNEEITFTTMEGGTYYEWDTTGHTFVPSDYENRIISVEKQSKDNEERISDLENISKSSMFTMYISPNGNDDNDGLTADAPKKTVLACVKAGASRISAKRGVYNERVNLSNIDILEIFPTDNDYTHIDVLRYPHIVFDTSDTITIDSLVNYNSIKSFPYMKENVALSYVFSNGLYDTCYSTTHGYYAVIWLITDNIKNDTKLRPVATIAEVEANKNTFTWVNNTIYLNANLENVKEIRIPTSYENAFEVITANRVKLTDVEVDFAGRYNILIENCPNIEIDNSITKYSSNGSGFDVKSGNGIFRNCYASKVHDGFGIGGCGHTMFIDPVAEFCYDDGMSHHIKCTGTVIGGRFEGNGKAGNCPAYGANVNIYGGIYKDNALWGICYATDDTHEPSNGIVQNAFIVGNPKGLVINNKCTVTALGCHYSDNTLDKENNGTLIEYN